MSKKEDFGLTMEIPEKAENLDVAEKLSHILEFFFKNRAKAVAIKVFPEKHELYIKPFTFFKPKYTDSFFSINSELKEELKENEFEQVSFMFADTFVEMWNKFMPMEFVFQYDSETSKISALWDIGMTDKQIHAYFFTHDRDGYNVKGKFWSREWLKPEYKQTSVGGGKV